MHKSLLRKRPGLVNRHVVLLNDNAKSYFAKITQKITYELGWFVLEVFYCYLANSNYKITHLTLKISVAIKQNFC